MSDAVISETAPNLTVLVLHHHHVFYACVGFEDQSQ